jgi:prepilin signal peptidase PulO-like enzyme (type II secretory pathway)
MNSSSNGNNLAIASIVLAVLGLCGFLCGGCIGASLFGLPAVITGILALSQIRQESMLGSTGSTKTLAWIGLIAGGAEIVLGVAITLAGFALLGTSYFLQYIVMDQLR